MIRLRHKLAIQLFRLYDQAALVVCLGTIIYFRPDAPWRGGDLASLLSRSYPLRDCLGMVLLALWWVAIFNHFIRYDSNRLIGLRSQIIDLIKACTGATFGLLVVGAFFNFTSISPLNIVSFWILTSCLGALSRTIIRRFLTEVRKSGYNYRYLLIIGWNVRARKLASRIGDHPELGYKIVGFIAEDSAEPLQGSNSGRERVVGRLADLKTILERGMVDEMLICLPIKQRFPEVSEVVSIAQELGIVARLIPEFPDAKLLKQLHLEDFEGEHVITFFRERLLFQLFVKRVADLVISTALLTVLSPLLVVVAVVIKITSPGPVLFSQERVGMNKRRFRLYKFRSMTVNAEQEKVKLSHLNEMDGPAFKIKNDPRITPFGKFMRKTSIDELPQLINVLSGEMSLVGPRPPLPGEVEEYEWLYRRRLSIKPGVTCLWQVNGRNLVSFRQWMEWDKQYIDNWSLWLDMKILMKTVPVVLLGKGAS